MKAFRLQLLVATLVACCLSAGAANAGLWGLTSTWVDARLVVPTGDISDTHETGFGVGVGAHFDVVPVVGALAEASWQHLGGKPTASAQGGATAKFEDVNIYGVAAGPIVSLGLVDVGAKVGYFFGDVEEWSVLPFARLSFWRAAVGAEYKATGDAKWFSAYAALCW